MCLCSYWFPSPPNPTGAMRRQAQVDVPWWGTPSLGSSNLWRTCNQTSQLCSWGEILIILERNHCALFSRRRWYVCFPKLLTLETFESLEQRLPVSLFKRCVDNLVGSGQGILMRLQSNWGCSNLKPRLAQRICFSDHFSGCWKVWIPHCCLTSSFSYLPHEPLYTWACSRQGS